MRFGNAATRKTDPRLDSSLRFLFSNSLDSLNSSN
jgi:hypothetical protein